jgi:hypothetical protein
MIKLRASCKLRTCPSSDVGSQPHIVVLICIFLMTNDIENLVMFLWVFVYPLWRTTSLDPLPVFKLGFIKNYKSFLYIRYKSDILLTQVWELKSGPHSHSAHMLPLSSTPSPSALSSCVFWSMKVLNFDEVQFIYYRWFLRPPIWPPHLPSAIIYLETANVVFLSVKLVIVAFCL